jgi:ribonuclease R
MAIEQTDILKALAKEPEGVLTLKGILTRVTRRGRPEKGARNQLLALLRRMIKAGNVEQVVGGFRAVGAQRDPEPETVDWVGVIQVRASGGVIRPYRDRAKWQVKVAEGDLSGARDGEVVVAVPVSGAGKSRAGGDDREEFQGRVTERLGRPGDPEADYRAVVWHRRIRVAFDKDILNEADSIPEQLDLDEVRRRIDLREMPFLTIDPPDARDHDDALCVEEEGDDLRLWVAIADVAHYVTPDSELDREALIRGNSIYFPDRVIPMLPERISGDLCSLRAGRDRFAMVVEMRINRKGEVERQGFYPAVIRCRAGLSYAEAAEGMSASKTPESELSPKLDSVILRQLGLLSSVEVRLSDSRFSAGSIDFDLPEGQIILDDAGLPIEIVARERTQAHRAVEEAMLVANRSVASLLTRNGAGGVFRVHESPAQDKLDTLGELLQTFGHLKGSTRRGAAGDGLDAAEIHRALRRAKGAPEERLVNMVALRSMKQARYSAEDTGHYALGFSSYLHFTSPIRRYADLVVHRALKAWAAAGGGEFEQTIEGGQIWLERTAARISLRERVAVEAEREMVDLKKCVYMARHRGEDFDGVISGVTEHGLYVTLDEHFVDGLVPIWTLNDELIYDELQHSLVAKRSGVRYRLGDTMRIRVEEVDQIKGRIRFALIGKDGVPETGGGRRDLRSNRPARAGRRPQPKARRKGAPSRGKSRR